MKNIILILTVLFLSTSTHAQKICEWRGGTPGRERDWNCSKNWSTGRVPDAFSDVFIPDCSSKGGFYPVITRRVTINSLSVDHSATFYFTNYDLVHTSTTPETKNLSLNQFNNN